MGEFPTNIRIDIKQPIDNAVAWAAVAWAPFFDALREFTLGIVVFFENVLGFMPWWLMILIVAILGWRVSRNVWAGLAFAVMLTFIGAFGYWGLMINTVSLIITSVIFSLSIGIPLGILMAISRTFERISQPILDGMQTMPVYVYLIPAIYFFRTGKAPAIVATVIYAIAPVMRFTCHAILQVDREVVEAAKSFGATKWQSLKKVELPQALPTIMAGVNQTIMLAISMVVTCSMIGAPGIGYEVISAVNKAEVGRGFQGGISIVFLAIIIDRLTRGLSNIGKNKKGRA